MDRMALHDVETYKRAEFVPFDTLSDTAKTLLKEKYSLDSAAFQSIYSHIMSERGLNAYVEASQQADAEKRRYRERIINSRNPETVIDWFRDDARWFFRFQQIYAEITENINAVYLPSQAELDAVAG